MFDSFSVAAQWNRNERAPPADKVQDFRHWMIQLRKRCLIVVHALCGKTQPHLIRSPSRGRPLLFWSSCYIPHLDHRAPLLTLDTKFKWTRLQWGIHVQKQADWCLRSQSYHWKLWFKLQLVRSSAQIEHTEPNTHKRSESQRTLQTTHLSVVHTLKRELTATSLRIQVLDTNLSGIALP